MINQINLAQIKVFKTIKASQFDLLNQISDISLALAAEIQQKIELVNISLNLMEIEFQTINERLDNLEGYFQSSLQEHIITSSLMDGVLHSNLRALTLAKTYHQYHAFLAAIISCSTAGNTTCQTLEELLG